MDIGYSVMAAGCPRGAPAIRYYQLSPVDLRLLLRPRILFNYHLQLTVLPV